MPLSVHPMTLGLLLACALISSACDDSSNSNGIDAGVSTADARGVGSTTDAQLTNLGQSDAAMSAPDAQVGDAAIPVNPCPDGQSRIDNICQDTECEPGAQVCQDGTLYICAPDGQSAQRDPARTCGDLTCIEGACRPIKHNVLVLFDTSESMNSCVTEDNQTYTDCCNGDCPGEWPVCEVADRPLSRLGYSKRVFQRFFSDPAVQETGRFALLTFPQTVIPFNNECSSSVYDFSNRITGDPGEHVSERDWFEANRSEVVRVPFARTWSGDNFNDILQWVDFEEDLERNPEIRATGLTPLGRSMFYAGEYLRHSVVVDGRPCAADVDCGSQDYICQEGACVDPLKHCRLNLLLVFTDGQESTHPLIDEFYNPVVQARRLKFGLRCEEQADCLSDAVCDDGYCRREMTRLDPCESDDQCPNDAFCEDGRCEVPGFLWPTDQGRCAQAGNPCIVDSSDPFPAECAGFLETCQPVEPRFWDRAQGANTLLGFDGQPISMTTHVINVSDAVNESRLIASHGGGLHFQVDLNDEEVLLRVLNRIVDYKRGGALCVPN